MLIDLTGGVDGIPRTLRSIVQLLRNGVRLEHNVDCRIMNVADTGLANATFTVAHHLDRVPVAYIWNIDRAGTVYDQSKATWTVNDMTLRCTVANAVVTLVVF